MAGLPTRGVLEKLGEDNLPPAIVKYFFCSPASDFSFRCLPAAGGLYDQRFRDYVEFGIIENKLREIAARRARSGS